MDTDMFIASENFCTGRYGRLGNSSRSSAWYKDSGVGLLQLNDATNPVIRKRKDKYTCFFFFFLIFALLFHVDTSGAALCEPTKCFTPSAH